MAYQLYNHGNYESDCSGSSGSEYKLIRMQFLAQNIDLEKFLLSCMVGIIMAIQSDTCIHFLNILILLIIPETANIYTIKISTTTHMHLRYACTVYAAYSWHIINSLQISSCVQYMQFITFPLHMNCMLLPAHS